VPRFLEHVQSSRALVCLHPEQTHFEKAAAFLRKHLDQRYSFVDCSSMVIAKELGLDRVLTTDHHFRRVVLRRRCCPRFYSARFEPFGGQPVNGREKPQKAQESGKAV
jgi:predicted nucleic acid-binding protein